MMIYMNYLHFPGHHSVRTLEGTLSSHWTIGNTLYNAPINRNMFKID